MQKLGEWETHYKWCVIEENFPYLILYPNLYLFASFTQWHHQPSPFFIIRSSDFHCPLPPFSLFFLVPGFTQSLIKSYTPFPYYSPFSLTSKSNNKWTHLRTFSNREEATQLGRFMVTNLNWTLNILRNISFSFSLLVHTNSFKCLLPASSLPSHDFYT